VDKGRLRAFPKGRAGELTTHLEQKPVTYKYGVVNRTLSFKWDIYLNQGQ
jgi:hypothetical protein